MDVTDQTTGQVPDCLRFGEDIASLVDLFSASWLMNVDRFRGIDTDAIATVEDACFSPFRQYGSELRMTRDWLDFAVEHMSKWWKIIDIFRHDDVFRDFVTTLDRFGHEPGIVEGGKGLADTIAIIAFMPYEDSTGRGEALTVSMLKACLRSLSRYGMGRAVVVVPTPGDRENCERAIADNCGEMTVIFRVAARVKTRFIEINMPYAAIEGLQQAFESDDEDWLGENPRWNAVYLTEPDTLLHIKPGVLSGLLDGVLNRGWVLSPHRLQPIPHASDLPYALDPVVVVPDDADYPVQTVASWNTSLWDSGDHRPPTRDCNNFWYMCGFRSGDHSNLRPYNLMRLSQGTGITLLMGSEHGRQCQLTPPAPRPRDPTPAKEKRVRRKHDNRYKRLVGVPDTVLITNYKCGYSSSNRLEHALVERIDGEDRVILFYRNIFLRTVSVFIQWCLQSDRYVTEKDWLFKNLRIRLAPEQYHEFLGMLHAERVVDAFRFFVEHLDEVMEMDNHTLPQVAIFDYYGYIDVHHFVELENCGEFRSLTGLEYPYEKKNRSDPRIKQSLLRCLGDSEPMQRRLCDLYRKDIEFFASHNIEIASSEVFG